MPNVVLSTLCLCVGICSLPGGDSDNFSLQRRPLDVSPLSANVPTRMTRSLLAARVIDHHGNPVNLRGNGQPIRRRVINPFVRSMTSHKRHQRPGTSDGNGRNYEANEIHTRVISGLPVAGSGRQRRGSRPLAPRQSLPASVGFATYGGRHYDIRPHRGVVPHGPANQRRRHRGSTNHRGRQSNVLTNHGPRSRTAAREKYDRQRTTTMRQSIKNKPKPPSTRRSRKDGPARHSSRRTTAIPRRTPQPKHVASRPASMYGSAISRAPGEAQSGFSNHRRLSSTSRGRGRGSGITASTASGRFSGSGITASTTSSRDGSSRTTASTTSSRGSRITGQTQPGLSQPGHRQPSSSGGGTSGSGQEIRQIQPQTGPDAASSVYSHGLEPHMPLNAQDMATFLIQRSNRPRQYVDRTKGTGTLLSSHPGQCPVVDQSRCAPLPAAPLPPSCSNDYHCHGERSKCCYDPCLTISKCVRPING